MPGRGRGRGRGRGGRFRGRGRGGGAQNEAARQMSWEMSKADTDDGQQYATIDIDKDVTPFFVGTASFEKHYWAQKKNSNRYLAAVKVLDNNGIDLSSNAKIRALAAAWARADKKMASALLANKNQFGFIEVLKAVTMLDAGRKVRAIEKKVKRLQMSGKKVRGRKMGKIKSDIDNLSLMKPLHGSATGAVCKQVRQWVRGLGPEDLEFYALHMPREPWKNLADICHLHPTEDFPALPWFLPYVFGKDAPADSMVHHCKDMTANNVDDLVKEYTVPYSFIRKLTKNIAPKTKARISQYTPLDQVIWYYEELQCTPADVIIQRRLQEPDVTVNLSVGKLLERLLTMKMIREDISLTNVEWEWNEQTETLSKRVRKPDVNKAPFLERLLGIAADKLSDVSVEMQAPIVIMGDRSGSMDVAIRTSTIIAAILTKITHAKLVFFNTENTEVQQPDTLLKVLDMAVSVEADAATAPAASLYPFYERKEVVKTFIIVTDEEENETFKDYKFLDLYKAYCEEVHPARLVFVSFLHDQHAKGQMVEELRAAGFNPMQFKFNALKPDLAKLDKLFGLLSTESGGFEDQLAAAERALRGDDLQQGMEDMKV